MMRLVAVVAGNSFLTIRSLIVLLTICWRADLYQKEGLQQLSDTSFYAEVDKDLTSTHQKLLVRSAFQTSYF